VYTRLAAVTVTLEAKKGIFIALQNTVATAGRPPGRFLLIELRALDVNSAQNMRGGWSNLRVTKKGEIADHATLGASAARLHPEAH